MQFSEHVVFYIHSKSERKFLFLQRKLEHIQERELTAQETLSQVLTVVSGSDFPTLINNLFLG